MKPRLRLILGLVLVGWPLLLCFWAVVHTAGWRAFLAGFSFIMVAAGLITLGAWLLSGDARW